MTEERANQIQVELMEQGIKKVFVPAADIDKYVLELQAYTGIHVVPVNVPTEGPDVWELMVV